MNPLSRDGRRVDRIKGTWRRTVEEVCDRLGKSRGWYIFYSTLLEEYVPPVISPILLSNFHILLLETDPKQIFSYSTTSRRSCHLLYSKFVPCLLPNWSTLFFPQPLLGFLLLKFCILMSSAHLSTQDLYSPFFLEYPMH